MTGLKQSGVPLPVHKARQIWRNLVGVLHLRHEDIWLTSFPRSGNTWFRIILANVIRVSRQEGAGITPPELDAIMPSLGLSDLSEPWHELCLPRFVKTHRAYIPTLFDRPRRSVLLVRDPRDALLSHYRLTTASTIEPFKGPFSEFLRSWRFGLPAYQRHFRSWYDRATVAISYENMRADPTKAVRNTLAAVGVDLQEDIITRAIELSDIERMRRIETQHGHRDPDRVVEGYRNFGKGAVGSWVTGFSEADKAYYASFCRRYPVMPSYP